jgi:hypothetical protein
MKVTEVAAMVCRGEMVSFCTGTVRREDTQGFDSLPWPCPTEYVRRGGLQVLEPWVHLSRFDLDSLPGEPRPSPGILLTLEGA